MSKYRLVHVIWEDSTSISGWINREEITDTKTQCESVGILVQTNTEFIALALSIANTGDSEQFGQVTVIPRRTIISIKDLIEKTRSDDNG